MVSTYQCTEPIYGQYVSLVAKQKIRVVEVDVIVKR